MFKNISRWQKQKNLYIKINKYFHFNKHAGWMNVWWYRMKFQWWFQWNFVIYTNISNFWHGHGLFYSSKQIFYSIPFLVILFLCIYFIFYCHLYFFNIFIVFIEVCIFCLFWELFLQHSMRIGKYDRITNKNIIIKKDKSMGKFYCGETKNESLCLRYNKTGNRELERCQMKIYS